MSPNQVKVAHEKSININRLAWNFESIFMDVSHTLEMATCVVNQLKNYSYCSHCMYYIIITLDYILYFLLEAFNITNIDLQNSIITILLSSLINKKVNTYELKSHFLANKSQIFLGVIFLGKKDGFNYI